MSLKQSLRSAYITAERHLPRRVPRVGSADTSAPKHPDVPIAVIGSQLTRASLTGEFPLVEITSPHLAAVIVEDGYTENLPAGVPVFHLTADTHFSPFAPARSHQPGEQADPYTLFPFVNPTLAYPSSAFRRRHHSVALLNVDNDEVIAAGERLAQEQRYHVARYRQRPNTLHDSVLDVATPKLDTLLGTVASTEVAVADPLWTPTCISLGTFALEVARTPQTDHTLSPDPQAGADNPSEITASEVYARVRMFSESPQFRERLLAQQQRRLWHSATATDRANHIIATLDIPWRPPTNPTVTVICSTNRPDQLPHLLAQFSHQTYPYREMIVATHGFAVSDDEQHTLLTTADNPEAQAPIRFMEMPAEWTLGQCLNMAVGNACGEITAKFDDDDYYLPNYLTDQVKALQITGADVVGKATCYYFVASINAIARRRPGEEHHYGSYVKGSTLVARTELFHQFPFPAQSVGEDTQFLKDVQRAGKRVYSTDRFNYLAMRGDQQAHTWRIDDAQLLTNATVETFGLNLDHVEA